MPALVLVALLGQGQAAVAAPRIAVSFQPSDVLVVTVTPPAGRTVKAIALDLQSGKTMKPRSREARRKDRVRATFERPHAAFDVVVTLDDGSTHRETHPSVYSVGPLRGDVLPLKPLPSPPY